MAAGYVPPRDEVTLQQNTKRPAPVWTGLFSGWRSLWAVGRGRGAISLSTPARKLRKWRSMALVVVGGHSRSVGKTSVVAGLIAALPEFHWTALKITQFGHGICSADGKPCDCDTGDDHFRAISEERDRSGETDSSRFLVAGAARSLWVRTRQGRLGEAMPDLERKIAEAENVIMESNSILRFKRPDIYLTVLDAANQDFKVSAREFLDKADAVILHKNDAVPNWEFVRMDRVEGKPTFLIQPPPYVTPEIVEFVRERLLALKTVGPQSSESRPSAN